jgi:hypothetical protein
MEKMLLLFYGVPYVSGMEFVLVHSIMQQPSWMTFQCIFVFLCS